MGMCGSARKVGFAPRKRSLSPRVLKPAKVRPSPPAKCECAVLRANGVDAPCRVCRTAKPAKVEDLKVGYRVEFQREIQLQSGRHPYANPVVITVPKGMIGTVTYHLGKGKVLVDISKVPTVDHLEQAEIPAVLNYLRLRMTREVIGTDLVNLVVV